MTGESFSIFEEPEPEANLTQPGLDHHANLRNNLDTIEDAGGSTSDSQSPASDTRGITAFLRQSDRSNPGNRKGKQPERETELFRRATAPEDPFSPSYTTPINAFPVLSQMQTRRRLSNPVGTPSSPNLRRAG